MAKPREIDIMAKVALHKWCPYLISPDRVENVSFHVLYQQHVSGIGSHYYDFGFKMVIDPRYLMF